MFHKRLLQFVRYIDTATDIPAVVAEVIKEERDGLTGGKDAAALSAQFLEEHKDSQRHRIAGAKVAMELWPDQASKYHDVLLNFDNGTIEVGQQQY